MIRKISLEALSSLEEVSKSSRGEAEGRVKSNWRRWSKSSPFELSREIRKLKKREEKIECDFVGLKFKFALHSAAEPITASSILWCVWIAALRIIGDNRARGWKEKKFGKAFRFEWRSEKERGKMFFLHFANRRRQNRRSANPFIKPRTCQETEVEGKLK